MISVIPGSIRCMKESALGWGLTCVHGRLVYCSVCEDNEARLNDFWIKFIERYSQGNYIPRGPYPPLQEDERQVWSYIFDRFFV